MTDEQVDRLATWAEETQRRLHRRDGGQRDNRDLCDLDAALSAVLALAKAVPPGDVEARWARLAGAYGMLEVLAERRVSDPVGLGILRRAKELAGEALATKEGRS